MAPLPSILIASVAILSTACSPAAQSPTTPTPTTTALTISRQIDVSGTWSGDYTIPTCSPNVPPLPCTGMAKPGTMSLALKQDGNSVSGVFTSTLVSPMDITGTVGLDGRITLAGERRTMTYCSGFPAGIELVSSLDQWSAELTKTGVISGSFRQSVLTGLGNCKGRTMYGYTTKADSLRRDAP